MPTRIAILGSTKGTASQPLIDGTKNGQLDASIDLVVSNKADAYILERATTHGLTTLILEKKKGESREDYDRRLVEALSDHQIDLILLIGWMRILSPVFVNAYKGKILNVHPSLLPKFPGGMDMNVHEEVLAAGETESGCTIHYVDESVDGGEILIQKKCSISPDETAESLKAKVQKLEGEAFIEAVKNW